MFVKQRRCVSAMTFSRPCTVKQITTAKYTSTHHTLQATLTNAIQCKFVYTPFNQIVSIHVCATSLGHPKTPEEALLIEDECKTSFFMAHVVFFRRVQGHRAAKTSSF